MIKTEKMIEVEELTALVKQMGRVANILQDRAEKLLEEIEVEGHTPML